MEADPAEEAAAGEDGEAAAAAAAPLEEGGEAAADGGEVSSIFIGTHWGGGLTSWGGSLRLPAYSKSRG